MNIDMFIFPYEQIEKHSKIILYGAGVVGKSYYAQLQHNNFASVVKWVDSEYSKYQEQELDVSCVDFDYSGIAFDYTVIAVENPHIAREIKTFLIEHGCPESKIIWDKPRVVKCFSEKKEDPYLCGYSAEENVQILISLLKQTNIKKVVLNPGTTNLCFSMSVQHDDFFECYSCIDERSAAYMACGMAIESGEPVVLSCTGATASRNYYPGLTEAFYRKIPVLAVTSSQFFGYVGNCVPQVIDRRTIPKDIAKISVRLSIPHTDDERWYCNQLANKAILELCHHGGGPVHIELETSYSNDFSVRKLPTARLIRRVEKGDLWPKLSAKSVAICIGAHKPFNKDDEKLIEVFCEKYNGVVLCDYLSNYDGKYAIYPSLILSGKKVKFDGREPDLLIHVGEVSAYSCNGMRPKTVWRVNDDGELRDPFKALSICFEMDTSTFFRHFSEECETTEQCKLSYYKQWEMAYKELTLSEDIPFSNVWITQIISNKLPSNAILHLGILNTLRCWSMFRPEKYIEAYCNTGGFGIDGSLSACIGAAIASPQKLFFMVIGDLSFFYDMNSLGNRHIGNNLRILLINNGQGAEFRTPEHPAEKFGEDTDLYTAASGHYGKQSRKLVKGFVENLGFRYLCAENKDDFIKNVNEFVDTEAIAQSVVFEVFINHYDEYKALRICGL
ncbi:thiamine pyrophosphate-binding protein [Butyrivibrio sp. VCB2001]|uniref:thiamine pyrophosphate-binding protein n=1 Tax=Butyrivibrio sp. VCB2001 TaxID=1280667 RepID=UPI00040E93E0|nr:thiamine pyrophosphate-binding protein [Butyrivibrio sp. VCB2001]